MLLQFVHPIDPQALPSSDSGKGQAKTAKTSKAPFQSFSTALFNFHQQRSEDSGVDIGDTRFKLKGLPVKRRSFVQQHLLSICPNEKPGAQEQKWTKTSKSKKIHKNLTCVLSVLSAIWEFARQSCLWKSFSLPHFATGGHKAKFWKTCTLDPGENRMLYSGKHLLNSSKPKPNPNCCSWGLFGEMPRAEIALSRLTWSNLNDPPCQPLMAWLKNPAGLTVSHRCYRWCARTNPACADLGCFMNILSIMQFPCRLLVVSNSFREGFASASHETGWFSRWKIASFGSSFFWAESRPAPLAAPLPAEMRWTSLNCKSHCFFLFYASSG